MLIRRCGRRGPATPCAWCRHSGTTSRACWTLSRSLAGMATRRMSARRTPFSSPVRSRSTATCNPDEGLLMGAWNTDPRRDRRRGDWRCYGTRNPMHDHTRIIGFTLWTPRCCMELLDIGGSMGSVPRQESVPNSSMAPCGIGNFLNGTVSLPQIAGGAPARVRGARAARGKIKYDTGSRA